MKDKIIASVKSGTKSERELIAQYNNLDRNKFSEDEFCEIVKAIEGELRDTFPRAANRIFGTKDKKVISELESILSTLPFDISDNKVKSHVKTGGGRKRGDLYIHNYISYKNSLGQKAVLRFEQTTFESELIAYVSNKQSKDSEVSQQAFNISQLDEAKKAYLELLSCYTKQ